MPRTQSYCLEHTAAETGGAGLLGPPSPARTPSSGDEGGEGGPEWTPGASQPHTAVLAAFPVTNGTTMLNAHISSLLHTGEPTRPVWGR